MGEGNWGVALSMEKTRPNIVDRPLPRGKNEVSLSAFSFLFSEMVQYTQRRCSQRNMADSEQRLCEMGEGVGWRVLDLLAIRDRSIKRELRLVAMLSYIQVSAWKALFGRSADSLEQSIDHDDEYMIIERHPL